MSNHRTTALRWLIGHPLRTFLWMTLALFAIRPAVEHGALLVVVDAIFTVVLVAVLHQLVQSRAVFYGLLGLVMVTVGLRLAQGTETMNWVTGIANIVSALLIALVIVCLLVYVLRAARVTHNTVLAAICVYVLLGVLWGFIFLIIHHANADAFDLGDGKAHPETQLRYFSMITLTTVGYGDIVPKSPEARAFAALEALFAQIYLAAIVARLVGIEVAHSVSEANASEPK